MSRQCVCLTCAWCSTCSVTSSSTLRCSIPSKHRQVLGGHWRGSTVSAVCRGHLLQFQYDQCNHLLHTMCQRLDKCRGGVYNVYYLQCAWRHYHDNLHEHDCRSQEDYRNREDSRGTNQPVVSRRNFRRSENTQIRTRHFPEWCLDSFCVICLCHMFILPGDFTRSNITDIFEFNPLYATSIYLILLEGVLDLQFSESI